MTIQSTLKQFRERFTLLSVGGFSVIPLQGSKDLENFLSEALTSQHEEDTREIREKVIEEIADHVYHGGLGEANIKNKELIDFAIKLQEYLDSLKKGQNE